MPSALLRECFGLRVANGCERDEANKWKAMPENVCLGD